MRYDIFIPCHPKDKEKLPLVIASVMKHLDPDTIAVCSPDPDALAGVGNVDGIELYHDTDVLPVNPEKFRYRPNWIYQQFLKLFQEVTSNDYYLTLDCDTVINRPIQLFEGDHPIWHTGWEQHNEPYYKFNREMLGIEKLYIGTFLADMNLFYRPVIRDGILRHSSHHLSTVKGIKVPFDKYGFVGAAQRVIDATCYPSEADLYGQYCEAEFPGLYIKKPLKQRIFGRHLKDGVWGIAEIKKNLLTLRDKDYDTVAHHSWQ